MSQLEKGRRSSWANNDNGNTWQSLGSSSCGTGSLFDRTIYRRMAHWSA